MQGVDPVIGGQLKALAIERERPVRDPVGVAADGRAKETPDRDIPCEILAAKDDIGEAPGAIRREDRLQRRAIADNAHLKTIVAAQPHGFNLRAVRQTPENLVINLFVQLRHAQSSMHGSTSRRRPSMKASATWAS